MAFALLLPDGVVAVRVVTDEENEEAATLILHGERCEKRTFVTYSRNAVYTFYLNDLKDDTKYRYRVNDITGSFKTLPRCKQDAKFRLESCFGSAPKDGVFSTEDVDFSLVVGDAIYADQFFLGNVSKIEKYRPAITEKDYSEIYETNFYKVEKIMESLKGHLTVFLADDHDSFIDDGFSFFRKFTYNETAMQVATNIVYAMYAIGAPETLAPPPPIPALPQDDEHVLWSINSPNYIKSKSNGLQSFKDHLFPTTKYFSFKHGEEIEFFVIDMNTERNFEEPMSLMSDTQMQWLLKGLKNSKATVKFIVTSQGFTDNIIVPRTPMTASATKVSFDELNNLLVHNPDIYTPLVTLQGAFPQGLDLYNSLSNEEKYQVFGKAVALLNGAGWMFFDKRNTIYNTKKQRDQVVHFIKKYNIEGVIFLSGDLHTSYISYVDDLSTGAFPLLEITGSPNGSTPETTLLQYMADHPEQRQYIYALGEKNYATISTSLKYSKLKVEFTKEKGVDTVIIDLDKYKRLQKGENVTGVVTIN